MALKRLTFDDVKFSVEEGFLKTDGGADLWFDQKRVKDSLEQISNGYDDRNLYLSGNFTHEDREYLVELLKNSVKGDFELHDWCYIYNFKEPRNPIAVKLSPGEASKFKLHMKRLLESFKREIPEVLENKDFSLRIREIINKTNEQIDKNFTILKDEAAKLDFIVKPSAKGLQVNPIINGKLITEREFSALSDEQKREIEKKRHALDSKIVDYLEKTRILEKNRWDEIEKIKKETILLVISHYIDEVEAYHPDNKIKEYLKGLEEYTLEHAEEFLPEKTPHFMFPTDGKMLPFEINLLVDASKQKTPPIIYEDNPTFYNVIGKIEKKAMFGNLVTDFTLIKPGALHKANGGYLILDADRVLSRPGSWWALKNALLSHSIKIEELQEQFGFLTTTSMKPEPIALSTKVILLGSRYLYSLLSAYDQEFNQLFSLKADFDYSIALSKKNAQSILSILQNRYNNVRFSKSAYEEIVKYSSKTAGSRKKINPNIVKIASICKEAVSRSKSSSNGIIKVTGQQIREAIKSDIYRKELLREKIVEMVKDNQIIIETKGKKIGQVNGLAVLRDGDFMFGTVNRISASCFMGKSGVVNIERESDLAGKTFNKASMIISGYIGQKYAQKHPLSLSASLAFEQSYGMIDGDSASVAELIAILSRIADIPIRQDIAVTGSLSQAGEVQPIGGLIEKIEGFYRICKEKGLSGTQGVLFPEQNMINLILPDEIEEMINKKRFHLFTMNNIDDAIELFTGMPAGKAIKSGYEKNSFHYLVDKKLKKYSKYGLNFEKNA